MTLQTALKARNPNQVVAIRLPASPAVAPRVLELTRQGAEVLHLVFDAHGRETGCVSPRHMRDVLREVHASLVKAGVRDEITLIASGGIALAEHMAKAIICGADLVAVDVPLVVALECRLCGECQKENRLPHRLGGNRRRLGRPPHREPDGRVAFPVARGARRDGHPRSPPPAWRDGPLHVLRGPRTRGFWQTVRKEEGRQVASRPEPAQRSSDMPATQRDDRNEYMPELRCASSGLRN